MGTEKTLKIGKQFRGIEVRQEDINTDKRTVALSFSSEAPVERWFGNEILDHTKSAVDLKRIKRGGALLIDHDPGNQVGVIEEVLIDEADRKGRATVRFGRSAKAEEIFQDVVDGIRSNVSVGYMVHEMKLEKSSDKGPDTYRVSRWEPMEISFVSIPADINVGLGRSDENGKEIRVEIPEEKNTNIPAEEPAPKETAIMEKPEVDVKAVQDEARQTEKARVIEIRTMGKKFKCEDTADTFIDSGKSVEEMRVAVLDKLHAAPPIDTTRDLLSPKEAKEYSYARALSAGLAIAEGQRVSSFEMEVSAELSRLAPQNMTKRGGIFIPLQTRAGIDAHTTNAGTEMVFTQYGGEIIEALRNMSVCANLGTRIRTGLTSPIGFPKKTSEGAATWVAENPGSDASDADDATDIVTLSPKGLTRSTSISRIYLTTSVQDAEMDVRDSISAAIALAVDRAGIHGSGSSNQPTGIYTAGDVNAKAMGGVPTFGKLIDMISAVADDNAILGALGFATTPLMAGKLMQTLVASAAGSAMIWNGKINDGQVCGYKAIASNQVSKVMTGSTTTGGSEHGIVFGNWADLLIGMFGGLEIVVDPYAKKKQGMIEYTIYGMADVALRHGQSFCKATGATIA